MDSKKEFDSVIKRMLNKTLVSYLINHPSAAIVEEALTRMERNNKCQED